MACGLAFRHVSVGMKRPGYDHSHLWDRLGQTTRALFSILPLTLALPHLLWLRAELVTGKSLCIQERPRNRERKESEARPREKLGRAKSCSQHFPDPRQGCPVQQPKHRGGKTPGFRS